MAKPSKLPDWDTTEVNSVEPDTTHKKQGWLAPGGVPEKPPFQTFNYWMNTVWKWIKSFNQQGVVEWDGTTTYDTNDITKGSDGFLYSSLKSSNTNKDPLLEPTYWSPLASKGSGYKNLIINGDKRVNQREYDDGVLADGVYGYDRWKGADSDANIEQIIEQQNIASGTYTISFDGGGTATVAGVTGLSSGDSVTITVSSDISVKVPKGASKIQLEAGGIATDFEQRNIEIELALCQRYYEVLKGYYKLSAIVYRAVGGSTPFVYAVTKRVLPSVTATITPDPDTGSICSFANVSLNSVGATISSPDGTAGATFEFFINAEL